MLKCYDLLAEAAPESALAVSADAEFSALVPYHFVILDGMGILQMGLELFPTVKNLSALINLAMRICLMAAPCLYLVMTSVLMPLPIIFAAEAFGAGGKSTAVGTSMTLLMFPDSNKSEGISGSNEDSLQIALSRHPLMTLITFKVLLLGLSVKVIQGVLMLVLAILAFYIETRENPSDRRKDVLRAT